jgi:hypothetical protein
MKGWGATSSCTSPSACEPRHQGILGLWLEQNEGAKFWLRVMTELKYRGVECVLGAVVDGLKGFPDAITPVFPHATIQTCIVHLLRHSLDFVSWMDRKPVAGRALHPHASTNRIADRLIVLQRGFGNRIVLAALDVGFDMSSKSRCFVRSRIGAVVIGSGKGRPPSFPPSTDMQGRVLQTLYRPRSGTACHISMTANSAFGLRLMAVCVCPRLVPLDLAAFGTYIRRPDDSRDLALARAIGENILCSQCHKSAYYW